MPTPVNSAEQVLIAYAENRISHLNRGICPDGISGFDQRDPECPVCQALSAAPKPGAGWGPVAEAPKDGTVVLLWLRSPWSEPRIAYWYEPWGNWQPQGHIPDAIEDDVSGIGADVPIAWAPLPPSPEAEVSHDQH